MSGDLISQSAYARRVGISPQLLHHHIKTGTVPVHGDQRRVSVAEADDALRDVLNVGVVAKVASIATPPVAGSKAAEAGEAKVLTLHEARAERARQDAVRARLAKEKEEIELALLKGAVVRLGEVEAEWTAVLGALRSRLLAIPAKAAARVAAMSDPSAVKAFLDDEMRLALDELSGAREGGEPPSDGASARDAVGPGPAAAADAERVGGRERLPVARDKRRAG